MLSSVLIQMALLAQIGVDPAAAPAAAPAVEAPAPPPSATTPAKAPTHESGLLTRILLKFTFVGAEWVLWLLLLLSVISIALIVERGLYFYNHQVDADQLSEQLEGLLHAGDVRAAFEAVSGSDCIEHEVVAAGLPALRRGVTACSEAMLSAKARLRPLLDARLSVLGTIGANAPFVGLLGTVLGIVKAAHDLTGGGAAGQGDPNAVMAGVFEALVATAVGLFVAIPAVVSFNLFQRRVRNTLAGVDSLAHMVLSNVRVDAERRRRIRGRSAIRRAARSHEDFVMAASGSSSFDDDGVMSDINVTPLVDVTLVLLIVFMITVPAIVGSAPIKVNLPESGAVAPASELPPMTVSVQRTESGALAIYVNDRPTNKQGLEALIKSIGLPPEDQPVTLAADQSLPYGEVIGVMDMLHELGLRKIAVDTRHVEGR